MSFTSVVTRRCQTQKIKYYFFFINNEIQHKFRCDVSLSMPSMPRNKQEPQQTAIHKKKQLTHLTQPKLDPLLSYKICFFSYNS